MVEQRGSLGHTPVFRPIQGKGGEKQTSGGILEL